MCLYIYIERERYTIKLCKRKILKSTESCLKNYRKLQTAKAAKKTA